MAPRQTGRGAGTEGLMERIARYCRRLVVAVLAAAPLSGTHSGDAQALAGSEPNKLVPHRAVYEMKLDDTRSASGITGITGIDGRMVFEFTGSACDGYSLNMRMVTQMTDSQDQTNMTDLRSSTWEQGDGGKFRFQSSQYVNEKPGDVTMGRAVRETPSEAIKVKLSQPAQAEIKLSGPVLFPTQHSLALIEKARAGQTAFQARVYDGSEKGRKVYETTAFIGKTVPPGGDAKLEARRQGTGRSRVVAGVDRLFRGTDRRSHAELSDRFPALRQRRQPRASHRLWHLLGPRDFDRARVSQGPRVPLRGLWTPRSPGQDAGCLQAHQPALPRFCRPSKEIRYGFPVKLPAL